MIKGKILLLEATLQKQGNGQCIPHCQGCRGTCRGSQLQRTGLFLDRDVEKNVTGLGQGAARWIAGHGDQRQSHALDDRQDTGNLFGLPGIGDCNDDIAFHQDSQITMHAFGWMQEYRRCSRRSHGCCHLLTDQA